MGELVHVHAAFSTTSIVRYKEQDGHARCIHITPIPYKIEVTVTPCQPLMVGWLVVWLDGWLVCWVGGWLVGWLVS